ncbi:penicillin acylase family protein [Hydrogenophaga sp. MI9]|uniref:penicillin acylase family protein n=1 Tax=Hydrogenophaga sp. MI9 TaxID=3453719 RepID=UPI003EEF98AB
MRWVKRSAQGLAALLMLVLVALAYLALRSLPVMDGELALPGLRSPVQVQRDDADITHIHAKDPRDAWMALGYVHAQERGWQLEMNRRLMRGQLSEVFGKSTLETDLLMRTLGIRQAARAQIAGLDEPSRQALQAYSDGVNAFFAHRTGTLPPEFQILRIDPREEAAAGRYWEPEDSAGWSLMMALDLGGNWGNELARLSALQVLDTKALWELFPPYPGETPAASADLATLYRQLGVFRTTPAVSLTAPPTGDRLAQGIREWVDTLGHVDSKGSNNWVVDGAHSASGKPLLANDPHLGLSAPAIWYFARLQAPDVAGLRGMDVIGATLPGTPFVVLGRTPDVAWGFTNTGPDVQDLYLEQIDPKDPKRYRLPAPAGQEAWATFTERVETFKVKGGPDVTHTVRSTRHGPVLSDVPGRTQELVDTGRYAVALRWTALDADNRNVQATAASNRARSVAELLEAFRDFHSPMQNAVMADRSGRIAYKAVGRVPVRAAGNDIRGIAPSPGWDVRYDWTGWLPYDDTPQDDGRRGWIATANQRIHAADYPHFLTQDWAAPYRHQRIESLLAATPRHDMASFRAIHADQHSEATLLLVPYLLKAPSTHALADAAKAQFKGFAGDMSANAAAPLIFSAWVDEFTRGVIGGRLGKEKFEKLYGKRLFRSAVEGILARDDKAWCGAQGCAAASGAALDRALDKIAAQQGREVPGWRWGVAHPALSVHRPFSNVGALAPMFEVRRETGGDPFTVNVGQYHLDKADAPYANRHAASMRAIYDLADPENSRFIYQTGQSGNPLSGRYRDMADGWVAVEYRPLRMAPGAWRSSLTLHP